jgi:hypothetical protein
MAYVINRGTKAAPNLKGRYCDADGTWRTVKIPDEHAESKRAAKKWIEDEQERIDPARRPKQKRRPRKRPGMAHPTRESAAAVLGRLKDESALVDRWLEIEKRGGLCPGCGRPVPPPPAEVPF